MAAIVARRAARAGGPPAFAPVRRRCREVMDTANKRCTPRDMPQSREMSSSSESEVIAQQLSAIGARITRLEARLAEVDPVIARLEGAALTTARSMQEISKHWDAVYEAMRREEHQDDGSSLANARRPQPGEPHESSARDAS